MASSQQISHGAPQGAPRRTRARNLALWAGCVLVWFVIDRASKIYFDSSYSPGQIAVRFGDVLQFSLVHNKGVAWGAFSGALSPIILFTALLCLALLGYAWWRSPRAGVFEVVSCALVFAGGIGNLYDRIVYGYVVDFISPRFIDFPTFNVADIGVTCGVVCLALVWVALISRDEHSDDARPLDRGASVKRSDDVKE